MLEAKQLRCIRDERRLFDRLSFTIQPGELVQVEGPNGAGKTSLLRIIAGLAMAEQGDILWRGELIHRCREEFNYSLLYLGHHPGIKTMLTPLENLAFFQQALGQKNNDAIWLALAKVGLLGYEEVPVAQLSAGQQRRVALARLWLSQAPLWILDEPLTAIDKQGVGQLIELFSQHAYHGGMVLFTTHQEIEHAGQEIKKIKLTGGERY